ncbi:MAG TPA: GWxTD domain-containing protein [Thermoanaerobaculia bacterium]
MKTRTILAAAAVAAIAASALALSPDRAEFGQGAAQFLMTKEETAQWRTLQSDADADAFIALFWARRDPTPGTPRNEFREEFVRRVQSADKNFTENRTKGSLTDRGKMLILFGPPKRRELSGAAKPEAVTSPFNQADNDDRPDTEAQNWIYEGESAKPFFAATRAVISFADVYHRGEMKVQRGSVDVSAAQQRAIRLAITQPDLTAPPVYTTAAAAPQASAPAAAAAPAIVNELTTPALRTAVAEFRAATKNPYENRVFTSWGEYVTATGQYFVPVVLYVPKSANLTASPNLVFFGQVEDAAGKPILAFQEPAKLTASKDDFYVDKSLALPAGKHRGIFGLAQDGKPVLMATSTMEVAGALDKDAAGVSQLILSNNTYPMTEAQAPDDPYSFGGIKVVPKADKTFHTSDDLWYFFELRNPGLADVATTEGTVPVSGAPAAIPKIQVKIDVTGTGPDGTPIKKGLPLREAQALELKGVTGHYGVGSAIPLASFAPGDYTFTIKIIDTVKKASYTLSDSFKVVQ